MLSTPLPSHFHLSTASQTSKNLKNADLEADQPLLILEAMKMEHTLKAPLAGTVEQVAAQEGEQVTDGQLLVKITEDEA